jgi:hypothetical protein
MHHVHDDARILTEAMHYEMPKIVQGKAKQLIHEMYLAPTRKTALEAYDQFISSYQIKFQKACQCLEKGATEDGSKELLAVVDGYREGTQSWRELLGQLKRRQPHYLCWESTPRWWCRLLNAFGNSYFPALAPGAACSASATLDIERASMTGSTLCFGRK